MGSYCELKLGSIHLDSAKNTYNPYLLFLFQESDKQVNYTTIGEAGLSGQYGDLDDDTPLRFFIYSCPASVVRDRLELMGYTKITAQRGFYQAREAQRERFEGYIRDWGPGHYTGHLGTVAGVLESLTLEEWLSAFEEIQTNNYKSTNWQSDDYDTYSPLLKYMLTENAFGFPGYDTLMYLRLIVDLFPNDEELVYDLTELANGGWVNEADDIIVMLDAEVSATYSASRRYIIMTEGSSDTWVIQRSLKLFYPHLYDYFKFLDFEGAKIGGGAGMLANTIKAFAGAGIINRIVALFDNDTAASAAMRTLTLIDIPNNIQVKQYPHLALAECFPTLGPTGLSNADINGLACSIELYLGEDVLKQDALAFYPVQWRGYDTGIKQYQGEILGKTDILNRFHSKLEACEKDHNLIENYDWKGLQLILNVILTAFHEQDAEAILNEKEAF